MTTPKKIFSCSLCLFTVAVALFAAPAHGETGAGPRLILQITVDQLRGDLPGRYMKNMGQGGFRYLMKQGVWYANANYTHANTETIVGHTILATGAQPSVNGMIGNVWFDRETGKLTYNIEDARYRLLTEGADVDKATEADPTQKVASTEGRSPAAILASTFGDELAVHTDGKAKVFGVSIKDRGAVSMAGHAGKAFWFSKQSGEFVTSSYYYESYPAWVIAWNEKKLPQSYAAKSWGLLYAKPTYLYGAADDQAWETDLGGFGRVFPHSYGRADGRLFTTLLTFSPAGDELTLDFAKTLIDAEQIGQDNVPDYLSVSFSSTDYVGHAFGPSSLEAEDNMLRLDRTLADLFAFIDQRVGLKNTLIVLSADHGAPEAPGYLESLRMESKYVTPEKWDKAPAIEALKSRFGIGKELIKIYFHPYLYLDQDAIREKGLNPADVEKAVAEELMKFEEVTLAVSSSALREGNLPNSPVIGTVLRNFHPKRSGDIYLVFKSNQFINEFDGATVTVTHGSPWRYDSFVPIVFAGGDLKGQRIYRDVEPADIAPTLAAVLGVKAPSGARGLPMYEVMRSFRE